MQCRPPDRPRVRPPARWPSTRLQPAGPTAGSVTDDDSQQNNAGPLGGPVIKQNARNEMKRWRYRLEHESGEWLKISPTVAGPVLKSHQPRWWNTQTAARCGDACCTHPRRQITPERCIYTYTHGTGGTSYVMFPGWLSLLSYVGWDKSGLEVLQVLSGSSVFAQLTRVPKSPTYNPLWQFSCCCRAHERDQQTHRHTNRPTTARAWQ